MAGSGANHVSDVVGLVMMGQQGDADLDRGKMRLI